MSLQSLTPAGRPSQVPSEEKSSGRSPRIGATAGSCESAARNRQTIGEARDGAGLAAGGSAGRSGRRAARARAAVRGRSPGPPRSWLGRPRRCGRGFAGPGRRPLQAPRRRAGFAGPATGSPLAAPGGKEYLAPATNARRCTRPPSECPQAVGAATAGGAEAERSRLAPVAQSVEQLTFNQWVPGSIPGGRTNQTKGLAKGPGPCSSSSHPSGTPSMRFRRARTSSSDVCPSHVGGPPGTTLTLVGASA